MKTANPGLNLRHLRAFLEVCRHGSILAAANAVHLSQPAITQGIQNLETQVHTKLFQRTARGMVPTDIGTQFQSRITRAFAHLIAGLPKTRQSPAERMIGRLTSVQLRTLLAIGKTRSYSDAARKLGVKQPTTYRTARALEHSLGFAIFDKNPSGITLTRQGLALFQGAQLWFSELDQAQQEISATLGQEGSEIRLGALPLARGTILAPAINHLLKSGLNMRVHVDDGPYNDLLQAVRSGVLDVLVGALRSPAPAKDVTQVPLFCDHLGLFCGPTHPLRGIDVINPDQLAAYPWVLPRPETPTRNYFDSAFPDIAIAAAPTLVETSSIVLVRNLLQSSQRLTLISRAQVVSEIQQGLLYELPFSLHDAPRTIGILHRTDWHPTVEQATFLRALHSASAQMASPRTIIVN